MIRRNFFEAAAATIAWLFGFRSTAVEAVEVLEPGVFTVWRPEFSPPGLLIDGFTVEPQFRQRPWKTAEGDYYVDAKPSWHDGWIMVVRGPTAVVKVFCETYGRIASPKTAVFETYQRHPDGRQELIETITCVGMTFVTLDSALEVGVFTVMGSQQVPAVRFTCSTVIRK